MYALYGDTGIYYVGLASGAEGIGGRLRDHTVDDHQWYWSRFSWFAFDSPSETEMYPDGVLKHEAWPSIEAEDKLVIREMEALLIAVTSPPGNVQRTRFRYGSKWSQVADSTPEVKTFADLKDRLT
ncbi:GIY-YIG nuclease family protein [Nocardioides sp. KR10-350]|uniref:GIY-YIG nuclease family protein n=1 Tax=Nocardioides cheoyonin TaxID=3156615 RepID=UPI0032B4DAE1